jgi:predicted RNase H-like HicB family nuclease
MSRARYEILSDDSSFYGEIPELPGVYASAQTLEGCREELQEVLEGWLLLRISRGLPVPSLGGVALPAFETV